MPTGRPLFLSAWHGWDNRYVTTAIQSGTQERVRRIQIVTIVWMVLEVSLSLWSAWKASSPALAAFGGDSAIELFSAVIVMWRFRIGASEQEERLAARIAGGLLVVLAVFVLSVSSISLLGYRVPQPSYLGMAVLVAALVIMPWLAREKRRLSAVTGSAALRADAAQSSLCAYLSFIALLGLSVHALWRIEWADPVAALIITPLILFEAREAFQGRARECC
jgi:divalent metal cation (Fe/Co/Zn/Cd) transporter